MLQHMRELDLSALASGKREAEDFGALQAGLAIHSTRLLHGLPVNRRRWAEIEALCVLELTASRHAALTAILEALTGAAEEQRWSEDVSHSRGSSAVARECSQTPDCSSCLLCMPVCDPVQDVKIDLNAAEIELAQWEEHQRQHLTSTAELIK